MTEGRKEIHAGREIRNFPFDGGVELRESPDGTGGSILTFRGYACITDSPYEMNDMFGAYTETVRRGAFKKTLSECADVAFLLNHQGPTLARTKSGTMRLAEDARGLHVEADLDPSNPIVESIRSAVSRNDMDEMSFAFRVTRQEWDESYENRSIVETNLNQGDTSLVNFGANPATGGTVSLRGLSVRSLADLMLEVRAGTALSSSNVATLKHILSLASSADTALDEAQIVLSDLLGVTNPDVAQDASLERSMTVEDCEFMDSRQFKFTWDAFIPEKPNNDELWLMQRRNQLRKYQGPSAA